MNQESQSQPQHQTSPIVSGTNSNSNNTRISRVPQKRGSMIKDQRRTLKNDHREQEEQSRQKINKIEYAKFGFGQSIHLQWQSKIQALLKGVKEFGKNPDRECPSWQHFWNQTKTIRKQKHLIFMQKTQNYHLLLAKDDSCKSQLAKEQYSIKKMEEYEYHIWQGFNQIQDAMRLGDSFPGLSGLIQSKINDLLLSLREVDSKIHRRNSMMKIKPEIEEINYQFTKKLIMKAFHYGIGHLEIDELQYFKLKQFEEGHSKKTYKPLQNEEQWMQFISNRRNKKRKADRFLLHTACQTCLSPYSEDVNPIITCPDCHFRNHLLCLNLNVVERCGRCIYSRLEQKTKKRIPKCFLCFTNNLTPIRITYNKFAHGFCLIANNLWDVVDGKLNMNPLAELQPKNQEIKLCNVCNEQGCYLKKCSHCDIHVHPMCAYLEGFRLKMDEKNEIMIDCSDKGIKETRRYILNYDKAVFQRLNQLKKKGKKRKD